MIDEISNEEFVKEMKIFWQNADVETRNNFMFMLKDYFDEGYRADKIIQKMQEGI